MYTNAFSVRELTPLLNANKPTDSEIRGFIKRAESIINQWIAKRYLTPIQKANNLTGTISTIKASSDLDVIESPYNTITGSGTSFLSEVKALDMIYVVSTGEALKVLSVESDTSIICTSNACIDSTDSEFFIIPDTLVTCSEYMTAQLILISHFSEKAYNQETETFFRQFDMIAKSLIESLRNGSYFDNTLVTQSDTNTNARLVYVGIDNDVRSYVDNNLSISTNNWFKK